MPRASPRRSSATPRSSTGGSRKPRRSRVGRPTGSARPKAARRTGRSRSSGNCPSSRSRSRRSSSGPSARPRRMPRSPDELRVLVEDALDGLELWPQLHGQAESVRYSITVGGKRVRPVICLATAEAAGAPPEAALPAGCALELVHTFSLVHDDLPALDDDEERRGQPSTWKQYGEAVGILAGDALLAEAFRLATSYETPHVARELAEATLGMIGGQHLDITGTAPDEATLHALKTGCLFSASVGLGLWAAELRESEQRDWRAFGDELGLLFQIVDGVLERHGHALQTGPGGPIRF